MNHIPSLNYRSRYNMSDTAWSIDAVENLLAGCILNIRLKRCGICNKYLFEMSNQEVEDYLTLLTTLVK